jgi:hypothetical protein
MAPFRDCLPRTSRHAREQRELPRLTKARMRLASRSDDQFVRHRDRSWQLLAALEAAAAYPSQEIGAPL